jgi:hypothetical protein
MIPPIMISCLCVASSRGGAFQSLRDGPYMRYLSYHTYEWDFPRFTGYPDSLLDADGVVHIWDPNINEYDPPVVIGGVIVTSYPSWNSLLWLEEEGLMMEHSKAPGGEVVEIVWHQESRVPIDLRGHLLGSARAHARTTQSLQSGDNRTTLGRMGIYSTSPWTGIDSHTVDLRQ